MTENYHTLALDGVPIFGLHNRTAAYRFVTLVDVSLFYSLLYMRPGIVIPHTVDNSVVKTITFEDHIAHAGDVRE